MSSQKTLKPKSNAVSSILIPCGAKRLVKKMRKHPMVITLGKKLKSSKEFGSKKLFWEPQYIEQIRTIDLDQDDIPPIKTTRDCYFTVAPALNKDKTTVSKTDKEQGSGKEGTDSTSTESICPFSEDAELNVAECKKVRCENRIHRPVRIKPEKQTLLELGSMYDECCVKTEEVEEVVGEVRAKMKFGKDPCFCTCECTFGYSKKTTYCNVCGGFEKVGEDFPKKPKHELPIPCPMFHKLMDKSKLKLITSGSDIKKRDESIGPKSLRTGSKSGTSSEKRSNPEKKSDSEKDRKKAKKAKDARFKFNYGYKGIPPQIGHCYCAMPCTGTLNPVPKRMGWLWTADNVPGLKFDPQWKPGAIHKFVYRLLRIAKNPDEAAKKRKKDTGKKKRPLKRPLLVVFKQNGEYTVTMETMKQYAKPRNVNQHPYEDKPVMTYTIGRTEEENRARQKKKERQQRRLERAQRLFIQSAFKDMCNEICLKTYQQALGILPDAEDPSCPCYPAEPGPDKTNFNVSCSCSEVSSSFNSDTDSDEWVVEFTPPNAYFDPKTKVKKVFKNDSASQYTYLDFRVKLIDRYGNPVPRFFKGPDGKQECSDLGGFWSPDHKWLEINIDGYIAPDGRWAPNTFIGPNGETVDAETGKFQAMNGKWIVVGVDGFIDVQGKWHFYPKSKGLMRSDDKKGRIIYGKSVMSGKSPKTVKPDDKSSWSCFGDISPLLLTKMGITGHGSDKKLLIKKLQELIARGEKITIPGFPPSGLTGKRRKKLRAQKTRTLTGTTISERKCMHAKPSDKGIEAVDEEGNKTYFRLKKFINKRPKERMEDLLKRGISLSSFHVPCLRSFINSEIMKQEQRKRLKALAARHG
ncbi:uncharacterized protein [Battus philenor]|uniref:uncharacterized protein n=1 Tax=Battus philenor TaxID=42288 RepID=UPI0035CF8998